MINSQERGDRGARRLGCANLKLVLEWIKYYASEG